jgi:hypothetical protein
MARIKTTRTVKVALWALRVYLLVLLTLIGIKFVRVFSSAQKPDQAAPTSPGTTNSPAVGALTPKSE